MEFLLFHFNINFCFEKYIYIYIFFMPFLQRAEKYHLPGGSSWWRGRREVSVFLRVALRLECRRIGEASIFQAYSQSAGNEETETRDRSTLPSRFRFPRETGFAYFNNILNGTLCVTAIHRRKELPPFLLCQIIEPWNKLTPNTHLSIREQCPLSKEAYYTRVSPILHRPVKALSLIRKYFNEPFQEASFQP